MKRVFLLLFSVLCSLSAVFAQRGTTIGINGSFNNTWIFWTNAYGMEEFDNTSMKFYKPSFGYDAMLTLGQNFVDILGLKAEVGTSVINQKYENPDFKSTKDVQLKYIQVPVMLRLASPGQNFMLHLMFGPQFGFLSSAKQSNVTLNAIDQEIKNYKNKVVYKPGESDISDRFNKIDLQGVLDIGFDVYLNDRLLLDFGIRLHGSIKDINKKDWQFTDSEKVDYYKSRIAYGGINLGLTYALKNWH